MQSAQLETVVAEMLLLQTMADWRPDPMLGSAHMASIVETEKTRMGPWDCRGLEILAFQVQAYSDWRRRKFSFEAL